MKPVKVFVPNTFDPEKHLPVELRKYADNARLFIHLVMRKTLFCDKTRHKLKNEYLKQLVGHNQAKPIREALHKAGVIECDFTKVLTKKSYCYWLGPVALAGTPALADVINKDCIKAWKKYKDSKVPTDPVHLHLLNWFNALEFDYEGALARLDKECADPLRRFYLRLSIERLKHRQWELVGDKRGRVHTPITNLWKEFKPFLSVNGKKLVNIDITCSQPFLFNLLLKNNMDINISLPSNRETYKVFSNDKALFEKLTTEGKLYEYLMELFNRHNRDSMKKDFFKYIFYGKGRANAFNITFAQHFPTVYAYVKHYKSKSYKELSLMMQRYEADLMIGCVCRRLLEEVPNAPVFTVHDSILTTPEHAYIVETIMMEEFARLELYPTIKMEWY